MAAGSESEVELEPSPQGGCFLRLRVTPGAKKNAVGGVHNGALKVSVTQVAERGKANLQVLKLLARSLGLKKSQLELVAGETSRDKRIICHHITPAELREQIARLKPIK